MENMIKFERSLKNAGGSRCVTIPKEIIRFLGLEDCSDVIISADISKHGKFMTMWKDEQPTEVQK